MTAIRPIGLRQRHTTDDTGSLTLYLWLRPLTP
jgi:hypothetical protein